MLPVTLTLNAEKMIKFKSLVIWPENTLMQNKWYHPNNEEAKQAKVEEAESLSSFPMTTEQSLCESVLEESCGCWNLLLSKIANVEMQMLT